MTRTAVIIVTHNSEKFIQKAWDCLAQQTKKPDLTVIVDSGSNDRNYLSFLSEKPHVKLIFAGNDIGFCKGNNIGFNEIPKDFDYVLLLNPDAFLMPNFIEEASIFMEKHEKAAAMTGPLLGYDIERDAPSGLYDSTGIVRTFFGKWKDRDQGTAVDNNKYTGPEEVLAMCGALMFLRIKAQRDVGILFDESFFMYKEDIDLCLRLRQKGWNLYFNPPLITYHCRGWDRNRQKMPKSFRLHSAKNELKIHLRMRSPLGTAYSSAKYLGVWLFNL
jgi:N-acetylglucosaminyl-diphospho-decaprenol L-rhamnosyltransferase